MRPTLLLCFCRSGPIIMYEDEAVLACTRAIADGGAVSVTVGAGVTGRATPSIARVDAALGGRRFGVQIVYRSRSVRVAGAQVIVPGPELPARVRVCGPGSFSGVLTRLTTGDRAFDGQHRTYASTANAHRALAEAASERNKKLVMILGVACVLVLLPFVALVLWLALR